VFAASRELLTAEISDQQRKYIPSVMIRHASNKLGMRPKETKMGTSNQNLLPMELQKNQ
jgi:hypothetical protein